MLLYGRSTPPPAQARAAGVPTRVTSTGGEGTVGATHAARPAEEVRR